LKLLKNTLEEFIKTQLTIVDATINPSQSLKDWIAHISPLSEDDKETQRIEKIFPAAILVPLLCPSEVVEGTTSVV
jgi:hypothetical protein